AFSSPFRHKNTPKSSDSCARAKPRYSRAMLGLDRRALQVAWTLFLFAALVGLVYAVRRTLMIFALALFFAHLLAPIVEVVNRFIPPRVSRTVSLAIVYILLVGALVSVTASLGGRIADEAGSLATRLPEAVKEDPLARLPIPSWLEPLRPRVT